MSSRAHPSWIPDLALLLAAFGGVHCGGCSTSSSRSSSGAPSAHSTKAPPVALSPVPPAPYRIMWHQVFEADLDAAAAFYADVTGWTTQRSGPDRVMCLGSAGPVANVQRITDEMKAAGVRPYWSAFVQVADVDTTTELARSHGWRVVFGPADVVGVRVASFVDGEGALLSVAHWTPPLPPRDRRMAGEFLWDEVVTRDAAGAATILGDLFAWKPVSEMPSGAAGKYVVFARDGIPVAGLFADPTIATSGWMSYVHVTDLDAALGRAKRAGGTVMLGPQVAGDERLAQVRDPQGAIFGLREGAAVTR
jgi:hypothetical protein